MGDQYGGTAAAIAIHRAEPGKRGQQLGRALDGLVRPSPEVARECSQEGADQETQEHADQAYGKGYPAADDDLAQEVAAPSGRCRAGTWGPSDVKQVPTSARILAKKLDRKTPSPASGANRSCPVSESRLYLMPYTWSPSAKEK